ncbi:hypothetical protein D3C81_1718530 [compost metagenome]
MINGRLRVLMKPMPMVARILSTGKCAAKAVTMAVTITTNMGLKRRTKPAMMTATPSRGHKLMSVGTGITPRCLNYFCRSLNYFCPIEGSFQ